MSSLPISNCLDVDRYEIGDGAARRRECEPGGTDDLGRPPPHRRTNAAVLQPGKDQERTEQRRHENRYDRKGPDIEMHAIDRYPPNSRRRAARAAK